MLDLTSRKERNQKPFKSKFIHPGKLVYYSNLNFGNCNFPKEMEEAVYGK